MLALDRMTSQALHGEPRLLPAHTEGGGEGKKEDKLSGRGSRADKIRPLSEGPESAEVGGIHASLRPNPVAGQPLLIDQVWPSGPAAKSRMVSSGDMILEVDSHSLVGKSVQEAQELIIGPAGSTLTLTLQQAGKKYPHKVSLQREPKNRSGIAGKGNARSKSPAKTAHTGAKMHEFERTKADLLRPLPDLRASPRKDEAGASAFETLERITPSEDGAVMKRRGAREHEQRRLRSWKEQTQSEGGTSERKKKRKPESKDPAWGGDAARAASVRNLDAKDMDGEPAETHVPHAETHMLHSERRVGV